MTATVLMLLLAAGLSFAEAGLGLGLLIPAETGVIVLAATADSLQLAVALGVVVALAACAGDHVGYLLGRHHGERLRRSRLVARLGVHHYDRSSRMLVRWGGTAVLVSRVLPLVRTVVPAAAGASGLGYRRFLAASLVGSAVWSALYVGGGTAIASVLDALGASTYVVAGVVSGTFLLLMLRAFRAPRPVPVVADA